MQVVPVGQPAAQSNQSQAPSKAESTRERAINAFMNPQGQNAAPQQELPRDLPVRNPNQVDPQELSHLTGTNNIQSDNSGDQTQAATQASPPTQESTSNKEAALSSQYAALARREKALRAQRMQLEQQKREWEAERTRLSAPPAQPPQPTFDASKYISLEDLAKDPFANLAKANLTYEQLVEQALNAPKPDEVRLMNNVNALQTKIKELEAKLDGTDKNIKAREAEARESAITQIRYDVNSLVKNDPAFEAIRNTGQQDEVVNLIIKTYDEGMGSDYPRGSMLDPYEAARMVEEEVAESLYNWASKTSKVSNRFKPAAPKVAPTQPAQKTQTSQTSSNSVQMRTLTNQMNASRQLSARDRAILAAEGKLGK